MAEVLSNYDSSDDKRRRYARVMRLRQGLLHSQNKKVNMFLLGYQRNGKRQRQMKNPFVWITWKRHVALFAL